MIRIFLICALACVAACSAPEPEVPAVQTVPLYPNETPALRAQIEAAAAANDIPVALVQRVVIRESTHRPEARNGPYYGLMQILPATARSMGFRGQPNDLLDAETNLKYATRYLRGAWLVSGNDMDAAVMWYARGYYYEAKRLGLIEETGVDGRKVWPD
ncbi:lytic transglycosylase domain-containing protein [uncultured Tateyamaria sp.]|uniref:lytic transglycosylase domain-containing protein n=1 Tax=uncultured Tateyamaria sp. TaxID=455651 RepID=UPI0026396D14|nr:lytic transglycosylase domain-containing protein [uncultured Tateyamaria sp.]